MRTGAGPYSKRKMRLLAALSAVFGVAFVVVGALDLCDGDPNGRDLLILGVVFIVIVAVGVPFGIRRGRL